MRLNHNRLKYIVKRVLNGLVFIGGFLFVNSLSADEQEDFFKPIKIQSQPLSSDSSWSDHLSGSFDLKVGYGVQKPPVLIGFDRSERGLANLRTNIFLKFEQSYNKRSKLILSGELETSFLNWSEGSDDIGFETSKFYIKESYLDYLVTDNLWFKAGVQKHNWGTSDVISHLNIINPRDLRFPIQEDFGEEIVPVPSVSLSYSRDSFLFELLGTYRAGSNIVSGRGSDFDPYISFSQSDIAINESDSNSSWEYLGRVQLKNNKSDLTIIAGRVNDNELHLSSFGDNNVQTVNFDQSRYTVLGLAGNRLAGKWKYSFELARYQDIHINSKDLRDSLPFDQQLLLVGATYFANPRFSISYDFTRTEIEEYEKPLSRSRIQMGHAFVLTYQYPKKGISTQIAYLDLGTDSGHIMRWNLKYQITDQLSWSATAVAYDSEVGSRNYVYRHSDALNLALRFSF